MSHSKSNTQASPFPRYDRYKDSGVEWVRIAYATLISQAVNKEWKKDLDLYKIYAGDPDFKKAFDEAIMHALELQEKQKSA